MSIKVFYVRAYEVPDTLPWVSPNPRLLNQLEGWYWVSEDEQGWFKDTPLGPFESAEEAELDAKEVL